MGIKDLYGGYRDNIGIIILPQVCGDYVDYKEYIGIIGTTTHFHGDYIISPDKDPLSNNQDSIER